MWNCACKVILFSGLIATVSAVATGGSPEKRKSSTVIFPRSINTPPRDHGGGSAVVAEALGNPAEWTMSKANLVAEFYTSEPNNPASNNNNNNGRDRSQKSIFSFLTNSNGSNNSKHGPPPSKGYSKFVNGNGNLMASGTNYNQPAILPPYDTSRNGGLGNNGGFSPPYRPIKFPQQNFIIPSGNPGSGYPSQQNFVRPPRGPPAPPPPSSQPFWDGNRPINGLRPPLPGQAPQQQPPPPLYLPPRANQPVSQVPPPPSPQMQLPTRDQQPAPPSQSYGPPAPPPQNYAPPAPPLQSFAPPAPPPPRNYPSPSPQYPVPQNNTFVPSQYLPPQPSPQSQTPPSSFQAGPPPPPQILDTYRKQALYPVPAPLPPQPAAGRPMVFIMANKSLDQYGPPSISPNQGPPPPFNHRPADTFTNYEQNSIPHPVPAPPQASPQSQQAQASLNALALTEPLSQVLAEANQKTGEGVDKTIRFVIHKPEDEDIVKNAILEDAQNRYEDVRFIQGPTLKVQRKETVYLPPKKKTVVYILLKEPQIDTDVQVMSPQEDEPAPEVYITYQKSDGAVKTKHYSPKPIREEDMKKYLDIEAETYGSGEESRIHPMFSKSTSVSLSTSSQTSRKSASISTARDGRDNYYNQENITALLANHNLSSNNETTSNTSNNATQILAPIKSSRLLSTSPNNSTSPYHPYPHHHRSKKGPRAVLPLPSPRRFLRNPIQCPTVT